MIGHWVGHLAKTAKHVAVLPPCLPVVNPCDVSHKWIIKRENWPAKIKLQERNKKSQRWKWHLIEHKWSYRRNSWLWECAARGTEGGGGELTDVNRVVVMKRMKMSWRKWRLKITHIRGTLGDISPHRKRKGKMLKWPMHRMEYDSLPRHWKDVRFVSYVMWQKEESAVKELLARFITLK